MPGIWSSAACGTSTISPASTTGEARACFRRAIEADPSLAEGYIWLVRCLNGTIFFGWSEDRAADLAEETAGRAAWRCGWPTRDPYALYALAIHSNSVGEAEQAIAAAQRAIDLSPSFALAHFILGVSRVFAGRTAQAIEPLQRGLRLNPNDAQAFVWLQFVALAHFLLGEHADAAERAAETVAMRPDYHVGYATLACSLAALGRAAAASRAVDGHAQGPAQSARPGAICWPASPTRPTAPD